MTLNAALCAALLKASPLVSLSKHRPTLNNDIGHCRRNHDGRFHPMQDANDGFHKAVCGYAADLVPTYETQAGQG